jgi:glycosyltransferase 2 family protein
MSTTGGTTGPPHCDDAPQEPDVAARGTSGRRRVVIRLVQAAIVAAAIYFLATYLRRSWDSVEDFDWTFDAGWLAASGVVFLLFYFAQAGFWWLLLRGCGAPSPFWPAASVWGKSILARYVPGNVFMFVGRAWMSHSCGLPMERVTAAMVYEQALGVAGALLAVAVLFPFWEYRPGITALSMLAIPVLVALMHPSIFGPLAGRALRLLHRPPLKVTLGFGAVLGMLCLFTTGWLVAGTGAWLLARAITGLGVDALPLVVVAYALAYVAGMVAFFIPSGIGVREAVLTASLSREMPGGVALTWALLLRLWVTAVELVFVGLVVGVELLLRRRDRA